MFTEQEISYGSTPEPPSAWWFTGRVRIMAETSPPGVLGQDVEKALSLIRNDRHRWALIRQNQGQVYFSHSFLY